MRHAALGLSLLVLAALWWGPLPQLAQHMFSAHMTLHMGVVAVAAPLLTLGLAGGRFDPVRAAPVLFAAIPASALEFVVVWLWHAPALHHAARHNWGGLVIEQSLFLLTGLLLWLSAFGGPAAHQPRRAAAGVIGLLLTSMHMTLLGALLALSPRPLYHHPAQSESPMLFKDAEIIGAICGSLSIRPPDPIRLAPLDDQHLGGAIMLLVGGVSYLVGGLWLAAGLLKGAILKPEART